MCVSGPSIGRLPKSTWECNYYHQISKTFVKNRRELQPPLSSAGVIFVMYMHSQQHLVTFHWISLTGDLDAFFFFFCLLFFFLHSAVSGCSYQSNVVFDCCFFTYAIERIDLCILFSVFLLLSVPIFFLSLPDFQVHPFLLHFQKICYHQSLISI